MNSISSWLCTNSTKTLFVKIVHPGGHVELHDRPILAAELLNRNPKCCVAHPTVFRQPYAVLTPETALVLGRKYYVVPVSTIRKLQLKYNPSVLRENDKARVAEIDKEEDDSSPCWLLRSSYKDSGKEKDGNGGCLQSMMKSRGSSSNGVGSSEEDGRKRVNRKDSSRSSSSSSSSTGRLPLASIDNWYPGLESIHEE